MVRGFRLDVVLSTVAVNGLYAIVNVPHAHGLDVETVTRALVSAADGPYASVVQLRAKGADTAQIIALLRKMAPICVPVGVPVLVNDDVDAALAGVAGVRGVHLGQRDSGAAEVETLRARARAAGHVDFIVGLSTHDPTRLRAACHQDPDYVAYGPVLPTANKAHPGPTVGLTGLLEACRQAWRPVVAIGGLNRESGAAAIQAGASAVAVIGGLSGSSPLAVQERARDLAQTFRAAAEPLDLDAVAEHVPVLDQDQLVELARWADDLGTHITLGLPARFRPIVEGSQVRFRPSDLLDLLHGLGKRPNEPWDQWRDRTITSPTSLGATLIQLRRSGDSEP